MHGTCFISDNAPFCLLVFVHHQRIDHAFVIPFQVPLCVLSFVHQVQPLTNAAPSATVNMTSQGRFVNWPSPRDPVTCLDKHIHMPLRQSSSRPLLATKDELQL